MAAISGATTTSSLAEIIAAEQIDPRLGQSARAIPVAEMVAFSQSVMGSNTVRFPFFEGVDPSYSEGSGRAGGETDEWTASEETTTEASATASSVAIRKAISDEARVFSSIGDPVQAIVAESFLAMLEQVDTDVLGRITAAANTSNHSGSDLTIERLGAAMAALRLRNGPGQMRIVLHETQLEDLKKSYRSAGLAYGAALSDQIAANLNGQLRGSVGVHEGVPLFASTKVPQYDASNWAGAVVRVGAAASESGLAFAVWRPIEFERARGGSGAARWKDELIVGSIYGSTLVRDDAVQEIVTSKS